MLNTWHSLKEDWGLVSLSLAQLIAFLMWQMARLRQFRNTYSPLMSPRTRNYTIFSDQVPPDHSMDPPQYARRLESRTQGWHSFLAAPSWLQSFLRVSGIALSSTRSRLTMLAFITLFILKAFIKVRRVRSEAALLKELMVAIRLGHNSYTSAQDAPSEASPSLLLKRRLLRWVCQLLFYNTLSVSVKGCLQLVRHQATTTIRTALMDYYHSRLFPNSSSHSYPIFYHAELATVTIGSMKAQQLLVVPPSQPEAQAVGRSNHLSSSFELPGTQKRGRIQDEADQTLCASTVVITYCGEFANHLAQLPYFFLLPWIDACSSIYLLHHTHGSGAAFLYTTFVILTSLSAKWLFEPPMGSMHASMLKALEGLRNAHQHIRENSESLALCHSTRFLNNLVHHASRRLHRTLTHLGIAHAVRTTVYSFLNLCVWEPATWWLLLSIPWSSSAQGGIQFASSSSPLSEVSVLRRCLWDIQKSVRRMFENGREVAHLAEYSQALGEFASVLDETTRRVSCPQEEEGEPEDAVASGAGPDSKDIIARFDPTTIRLHHTVLIAQLHWTLRPQECWMLAGPNGSGKSSLLRFLTRRAWCDSDHDTPMGLSHPNRSFYLNPRVYFIMVPQKTYLVPGKRSIAEQLMVPLFPELLDGEYTGIPQPLLYSLIVQALRKATVNVAALRSYRRDRVLAAVPEVQETTSLNSCTHGGVEGERDNDALYEELVFLDEGEQIDWNGVSGALRQKLGVARAFFQLAYLRYRMDSSSSLSASSNLGQEFDMEHIVMILDEATCQVDRTSEIEIYRSLRQEVEDCNGRHDSVAKSSQSHPSFQYISVVHRHSVAMYHDKVLLLEPFQEMAWTPVSHEEKGMQSTRNDKKSFEDKQRTNWRICAASELCETEVLA